jgi:mannose-6-phosphate isomerase-like protein (cupin superfamily)
MSADTCLLTPRERVTVVRDDPRLLVAELLLRPDPHRPPSHVHPDQDERFVVHHGVLRVRLPDGVRLVRAGEELEIPRGTAHTMAADGDRPVAATWEVRPAGGTRDLWAALDRTTRAYGVEGAPAPALARVLRRHHRAFRLALPRPLDRLAVVLLALLPARRPAGGGPAREGRSGRGRPTSVRGQHPSGDA